jgi:hypothetical protein
MMGQAQTAQQTAKTPLMGHPAMTLNLWSESHWVGDLLKQTKCILLLKQGPRPKNTIFKIQRTREN